MASNAERGHTGIETSSLSQFLPDMIRWTQRGSRKTTEIGRAAINGVEIEGAQKGLWIAKGIVLTPDDETVGSSAILYIAQLPEGPQKTVSALDIGPHGIHQHTARFRESTISMKAIGSDMDYLMRGRSGQSLLRPPEDDFSAWEAEALEYEPLDPVFTAGAFSELASALARHQDRTPVHVDLVGALASV